MVSEQYEVLTPAGASGTPVPAACAEPVERLLTALQTGWTVFVLEPCDVSGGAAAWLAEGRIEAALRRALILPAHIQVWPLLAGAWIVALRASGETACPLDTVTLLAARHTLAERLEADWRAACLATPVLRLAGDEENDDKANSESEPTPRAFLEAGADNETLNGARRDLPSKPAFTLYAVGALTTGENVQAHIDEMNALLEIIVNKQLHTQFQPIVNLRDGQVVGYEALIRSPKGASLRGGGALFHAADRAQMVSWFDLACLEQCFAQAAQMGGKHLLFVNMDAEGLAHMAQHERSLSLRAREHGLSPARIVVEITERQTVGDFPQLAAYIRQLREEGFKIAIDDAGAGYNSLHAIAEMRPEFVKVDRDLTRNLDVIGEKRALLAALVQFAKQIGTSVLAEGSETREELAALIDLGVPYGQGYLMGRPADHFRGVSRDLREFIQRRYQASGRIRAGQPVRIGDLMRAGVALPGETPLGVAAQKFARDESLTSIVVVEAGQVRGLLMRCQLDHVLEMAKAAEVGALLPDETLALWMRANLLLADADTPLLDVARQATTRSDIDWETDVVVVNAQGEYAGVLPARALMEAALSAVRHAPHSAERGR